jgi:hypothetical protein
MSSIHTTRRRVSLLGSTCSRRCTYLPRSRAPLVSVPPKTKPPDAAGVSVLSSELRFILGQYLPTVWSLRNRSAGEFEAWPFLLLADFGPTEL